MFSPAYSVDLLIDQRLLNGCHGSSNILCGSISPSISEFNFGPTRKVLSEDRRDIEDRAET